jgi:hypothetical protein
MNAIVVHQHDVSEIERMARAIAASKLFGVQNAEQAITLCLVAQAEGRHPASAAQDYHIISGRPSKKADAMLRDFINAGGKVQWHALDDTVADATFSHAAGGTVRISWDFARAKKAGIKNPMWDKYPRQMLRARTVSEGVRTVYPMATSGMYVPEEVSEFDAPLAQAAPVNVTPQAAIAPPAPTPQTGYPEQLRDAKTVAELEAVWEQIKFLSEEELPQADFDQLHVFHQSRLADLRKVAPADDDAFPGDMPAPRTLGDHLDNLERQERGAS